MSNTAETLNQSAEEVLQRALALPPAERARIADCIQSSLTPEQLETLRATEWTKEIERRSNDIVTNPGEFIDGDEFIREINERIRARRAQ